MIQALLVMLAVGAVCGLILGIAGKKFYVEKDTRVEDIRALLPGLNCGGCGKAGCDAMADLRHRHWQATWPPCVHCAEIRHVARSHRSWPPVPAALRGSV